MLNIVGRSFIIYRATRLDHIHTIDTDITIHNVGKKRHIKTGDHRAQTALHVVITFTSGLSALLRTRCYIPTVLPIFQIKLAPRQNNPHRLSIVVSQFHTLPVINNEVAPCVNTLCQDTADHKQAGPREYPPKRGDESEKYAHKLPSGLGPMLEASYPVRRGRLNVPGPEGNEIKVGRR